MTSATIQRRITEDEFYRMGETCEIPPDQRVELIEGEIINMTPIGPFHGDVVDELVEFFSDLNKGRWRVMGQRPLRIADDSLPQPDVMLVKRPAQPRGYRKRHATPEDVYLLVEVSDSTLRFDRSRKIPLYGRAGIREVWIINIADSILEVYLETNFKGFSRKLTYRMGEFVSPTAFPDVRIPVTALLEGAN